MTVSLSGRLRNVAYASTTSVSAAALVREAAVEIDRLRRLEAAVEDDSLCKQVTEQTRTSCVMSRQALFYYRDTLRKRAKGE